MAQLQIDYNFYKCKLSYFQFHWGISNILGELGDGIAIHVYNNALGGLIFIYSFLWV